MSTPFPAVIKEIRLGVTETVLTLDVSVPDVQTLAGLLDREVSVLITEPQGAARTPAARTPVSRTPVIPIATVVTDEPSPERLPFDPDDDPSAPPPTPRDRPPASPSKPRPPRRPAGSRR